MTSFVIAWTQSWFVKFYKITFLAQDQMEFLSNLPSATSIWSALLVQPLVNNKPVIFFQTSTLQRIFKLFLFCNKRSIRYGFRPELKLSSTNLQL